MTVFFQTTNTTTGATAFAFDGDTYVLFQGVTVANAGTALNGLSHSGTIIINGDVVGTLSSTGIAAGISGSTTFLDISSTAHVSGGSNNGAVFVAGSHEISNAGIISDFGSLAYGIRTTGAGEIFNSGQISGLSTGIQNLDNTSVDIVHLVNTGIISGSNSGGFFDGAYVGSSSIDQITNSGTMSGSVYTGSGNDQIVNYGHIYGNIDLGSENDTLYTDLSALGGPYTIQGGSGTDAVVNTDNDHTVSFNMADNGFEIFYGGAMASYVYGGTATAALTFVGRGAADAFIGGTGADVAIGGGGGDYLDGGAGSNTLSYSGSLLGVTVNLGAGTASGGDAAGDYFLNFQNLNGSAANDVLVGDGGANTLYGDAGNDYMFGSGGADLLIGAAGNDYLVGGAGNDIFYYGATGYGNDEIVDFTIGQDTLYISTSIAANFAGLTIFQYLADTYVGAGGNYFHLDNTVATNLHASDFVFF